jgi:hypothetical protein
MRQNRIPRIPAGCDQQGRYPEAAHAASEEDSYERDALWWIDDVFIAVGLTAIVLFLLICVGLVP